jgi:hypothetical protein
MTKSFAAFLAVMFLASIAPVLSGTLVGAGEPTFVGWSLAMVATLAIGVKFFLATLLSSDGFRVEKISADLALALAAVLLSLAIIQTHEETTILFPAVVAIFGDIAGYDAPGVAAARTAMWLAALMSIGVLIACTLIARWALTAPEPTNLYGRLRSQLWRLVAVILGTISFGLYFLAILHKQ